jgi:O-methyltransferase involved in polyketide biosynthesis
MLSALGRLLPARLAPGWQRISPTAHYTGYVWASHGLGDPRLATLEGRLLYSLTGLVQTPVGLLGGPRLEHFLLARHRIMDRLLTSEIESGRVGQVVELAAGMSPRGLSYVQAHPGLTYVETDLPEMAERKREVLDGIGTDSARHRVEAVDVFGPELVRVFDSLDPDTGVAVVTEGLLNYLATSQVEQLWGRLGEQQARFPFGCYVSDIHLDPGPRLADRAFAGVLGLVVLGRVHFHYDDEAGAESALLRAGFTEARLHAPREYADELPDMDAPGADRVRVVEAVVE